MQVQYSIFFFMNTVVMLCFLNKSSLVKNFDLSSVLPVDPVTYIMTNITFFFGWNLHLLLGMKPPNFKLPWDIFGDYVNAEAWVICFWWMSWYSAKRTSKSVMLGMPISCPACKTGRAKTGNESSARREIWDLSFGLRGHEPIFSMPMRCYF